jgi:uncharacterized membrane protein YphA (DoxX/SURF4 family)
MSLFSNKAIWKNAIVLLRIWSGIVFIYYPNHLFILKRCKVFADWLKEMNMPFSLFLAYISKGTEFIGEFFLIIGFLTRTKQINCPDRFGG